MNDRWLRWRHRLARWVVGGEFFRLTETGSWMVTHDADHGTTIAIRVAEWSGTLTTRLQPLEYDGTSLSAFNRTPTTGEFRGTFDA